MAKQTWKPGNMIYPLPAVMVSTADKKGNSNILTVAWTGTVCTNPPMAYISVRPERYSYHMIKESGEFVINLTTKKLIRATDYCGVRSGRDVDKTEKFGIPMQKVEGTEIQAPKNCRLLIHASVSQTVDADDHIIHVCDVKNVFADENVEAVFAWNGYAEFAEAQKK